MSDKIEQIDTEFWISGPFEVSERNEVSLLGILARKPLALAAGLLIGLCSILSQASSAVGVARQTALAGDADRPTQTDTVRVPGTATVLAMPGIVAAADEADARATTDLPS